MESDLDRKDGRAKLTSKLTLYVPTLSVSLVVVDAWRTHSDTGEEEEEEGANVVLLDEAVGDADDDVADLRARRAPPRWDSSDVICGW